MNTKPNLKLVEPKGWRARPIIVDFVVVAIFVVIAWRQDAPPWAITMMLFIATRASASTLNDAMRHLQQTIRRRRGDGYLDPVEHERMRAQLEGELIDQVAESIKPMPGQPSTRGGVGRWGRDKS